MKPKIVLKNRGKYEEAYLLNSKLIVDRRLKVAKSELEHLLLRYSGRLKDGEYYFFVILSKEIPKGGSIEERAKFDAEIDRLVSAGIKPLLEIFRKKGYPVRLLKRRVEEARGEIVETIVSFKKLGLKPPIGIAVGVDFQTGDLYMFSFEASEVSYEPLKNGELFKTKNISEVEDKREFFWFLYRLTVSVLEDMKKVKEERGEEVNRNTP